MSFTSARAPTRLEQSPGLGTS
uniref:Pco123869 n=1 Tax=Arundo donax TaxID=35708 RepID=A0A0A9ILQ4_ARUDO